LNYDILSEHFDAAMDLSSYAGISNMSKAQAEQAFDEELLIAVIKQIDMNQLAQFLKVAIEDVNVLPAKKITPYALWFDFLKDACSDPDVKVDTKIYQAWEPYADVSFIAWWPSHAHLFAVDFGVRVCKPTACSKICADDEVVVRIPLYQNKNRSLQEVSKILDDHGAGDRLCNMRQGEFQLTVGVSKGGQIIHPSTRFLRNLAKIKLYSFIYMCWLKFPGLDPADRLEETTMLFRDLVQKLRAIEFLPPEDLELPNCFTEYAKYIDARATRTRIPQREYFNLDIAANRRQIARYIQKARRIAANVGRGVFPGEYEENDQVRRTAPH
jgi:hypothetical protein